MNSKKYIVAVIVGFLLTSSSLLAQKKLVDDIYTYNYTKIINQNGGKAIAKKSDYPHQRALAYSLAQVEQKDRKSTRLNSSHVSESRMPSSA